MNSRARAKPGRRTARLSAGRFTRLPSAGLVPGLLVSFRDLAIFRPASVLNAVACKVADRFAGAPLFRGRYSRNGELPLRTSSQTPVAPPPPRHPGDRSAFVLKIAQCQPAERDGPGRVLRMPRGASAQAPQLLSVNISQSEPSPGPFRRAEGGAGPFPWLRHRSHCSHGRWASEREYSEESAPSLPPPPSTVDAKLSFTYLNPDK